MIACRNCKDTATIHITDMPEPRGQPATSHLCEQHFQSWWTEEMMGGQSRARLAWGEREELNGAVRFDIERIVLVVSGFDTPQVIYLQELGGKRRFPIVVGLFEATALDRNLKGTKSPRPLSHDAWVATIEALSGAIEYVRIDDFRDGIYFATIRIRQADRYVEIDARPSDALNIAVLSDCPIYVKEELAAKACL